MFDRVKYKILIGRKLILPKPIPCIIITNGRSGSNYLTSLLGSHPEVNSYGEILTDIWLDDEEFKARINNISVKNYVAGHFKRKHLEKVSIVKILYYQIETAYATRKSINNLDELISFLKLNTNIKIIHLKRLNKLETLLSKKAAILTKQIVLEDSEKRIEVPPIYLTKEECLKEFKKIEEWEAFYDSFFSGHPVLEIFYENLIGNQAHEIHRILKFLKLKSTPLGSKMIKQNTLPVKNRLTNYSALRNDFKNTKYAKLFS